MITYMYGFQYVIGYIIFDLTDYLSPKTLKNFYFTMSLLFLGNIYWVFILLPNLFYDLLLRLKLLSAYNRRAERMISETQIRNPSPVALANVEKYYSVLWAKQKGMTTIPKMFNKIPRHLKLGIIQDLSWAVFYHSPTFRKTSIPYKRWICEHIKLEYRLAGERLFSGLHCYSNMYYLKSGIVQFFAKDDTSAAMLTVTGGTIFGDVSAIVPPMHRRVVIRCLTYCEVFVVTRATILTSLHKFSEDRRNILKLVHSRMKHARCLFSLKKQIRGTDVVEDEGIAYIKKRWWEIAEAAATNKRLRRLSKRDLSTEETNYHCPKYIGQLVLCKEQQLQGDSMFARDQFPCLLSVNASFINIWNMIVYITLWIALLILPPGLVRMTIDRPTWFPIFLKSVDFIYGADIFVLLLTAIEEGDTLFTILINRCKNPYFILDLFATAWVDYFVMGVGLSALSNIVKFNRLLKIHLLFKDRRGFKWARNTVMRYRLIRIIVIQSILLYISGYFLYLFSELIPDLSGHDYFLTHCLVSNTTNCLFKDAGILSLSLVYIYRMLVENGSSSVKSKLDTLLNIGGSYVLYLMGFYTRAFCITVLYLKYKPIIDYQQYVSTLTSFFKMYKIHPKLKTHLDSYLECHWKYVVGAEILTPNQIMEEPYNVYWNVLGEVAEKTIRESDLFNGANPILIKELSERSQILLLPKSTKLITFGLLVNHVNWLVKVSACYILKYIFS